MNSVSRFRSAVDWQDTHLGGRIFRYLSIPTTHPHLDVYPQATVVSFSQDRGQAEKTRLASVRMTGPVKLAVSLAGELGSKGWVRLPSDYHGYPGSGVASGLCNGRGGRMLGGVGGRPGSCRPRTWSWYAGAPGWYDGRTGTLELAWTSVRFVRETIVR